MDDDNGSGVVQIRAARPEEAEVLLGIQQAASLAALRHLFPPGICSRRAGA